MYTIGIDLGGTNIAAGLVDENYKIIRKCSVPTEAERSADEIVKAMADVCQRLCDEEGITVDDISSVGIATPGTADTDKGEVIYANNLPFRNYPIASKLKANFPVKKVAIANDANAAAYGEAVAGAGAGKKNFVMLTLGTGVGGGIIIDGKLYTGFNYAAGELGHMVIVHNGRPCTCGRKGCFEAYSSATGLINIINIFQPEVLSIGGGISNEKDNLLAPLIPLVRAETYGSGIVQDTDIRIATLGNDAGIIGAALLG